MAFCSTLLMSSPAEACPGDCSGDRVVTVDELVRSVNIALGSQPVSSCPPADVDGNGAVEIAELVQAVNASLVGCPPDPTPTETRTATRVPSRTPSPTSTPLLSVCGGGPLTTTPQICSLVVQPETTVSLGTVTLRFSVADLDGGISTLCYGIAAPPNIPDPNRCRPFSILGAPLNGPASFVLQLPSLGRGTYAMAIVVADAASHLSNRATANFQVISTSVQ